MQHALSLPNTGDPAELVELARAADVGGWDGFFLWDHLHLPRAGDAPVHDPWVLLGAIAIRTEHVRIGTLVTALPRRRPHKVAKEVTTVDHLSNGRAVIGVGLGSPPELEYGAFGEPTDARERAILLDEGLVILDGLLRDGSVDFQGRRLSAKAEFHPRARQRPRPPIWVAGRAPNTQPLRRALRWDGYAPVATDGNPVPPDSLAQLMSGVRTPPGFDLIATRAPGTQPSDYEAAGATWLVESTWPEPGWQRRMAALARSGPDRS